MLGTSHSNHLSARWSFVDYAAVVCVLVLSALPFLQVGGFAFLNYDDPLHVSAQPAVLSGLNAQSVTWAMSATPSNLWHPLTWMSYMAEVSFFGGGAESPGVHHLGNLFLHQCATCFFFVLLRTLRVSTLVAGVVALIFSLHPLHVEPVAWISSRKDVLCAFFAMASLSCYSLSKQNKSRRWFWLTWLTFVAALTSKPAAIVLPALFMLLDYFPVPSQGMGTYLPWLKQVNLQFRDKWGYFMLSGVAVVITVMTQYSGSHGEFIGQQGIVSRLSYLPATIAFYLQHSLFPKPLTFEYAFPEGVRFAVLSLLGVVFLLGLVVLYWRRYAPALLVGCLWFLVCLAPVLGVFYVGSGFTADRYMYIALAGPALALAVWLQSLAVARRMMALGAVACVTLLFGVFSYQQVGVWKNDVTLFTHGVRVEPMSGTAQTNLATLYRGVGNDDLALIHYKKALKLHASYYIIYYNMAQIYSGRGERMKAVEACRLSLRSHPGYARSHHFLAQLLVATSTSLDDEAMLHFEQAYQLDPGNVRFALSCARAYAKRKRYAEASDVLRRIMTHGALSRQDKDDIEVMQGKLNLRLGRMPTKAL